MRSAQTNMLKNKMTTFSQ